MAQAARTELTRSEASVTLGSRFTHSLVCSYELSTDATKKNKQSLKQMLATVSRKNLHAEVESRCAGRTGGLVVARRYVPARGDAIWLTTRFHRLRRHTRQANGGSAGSFRRFKNSRNVEMSRAIFVQLEALKLSAPFFNGSNRAHRSTVREASRQASSTAFSSEPVEESP
jgi:hypothetical protein